MYYSKEESNCVDFERSGTVVVELSRDFVSWRVVIEKESHSYRRIAWVQHEESDSGQCCQDACKHRPTTSVTSIELRKVFPPQWFIQPSKNRTYLPRYSTLNRNCVNNKYVGPPYCHARVRRCPLVSYDMSTGQTNRQTNGRTDARSLHYAFR